MAFTKNDYKEIFKSSLNIQDEQVTDQLKYNDIEEWDSIGHMSLVSAIEDKFKISLETDDIIDFSSYKEGIKILKKYKIEIS
jgi:acyl carrier protein|tara:strand:- start:1269 stop:1514 length:246 start_codon:yes stop_codon:yes gene_type:complete